MLAQVSANTPDMLHQQSGGRQLYLTEIACQLLVVGSILTDPQGSDVALACIVVGATHNVV